MKQFDYEVTMMEQLPKELDFEFHRTGSLYLLPPWLSVDSYNLR